MKTGFEEPCSCMEKNSHSSKDSQASSHLNYHYPFLSGTIELSGGEIGQKRAIETDALQSQGTGSTLQVLIHFQTHEGSWK